MDVEYIRTLKGAREAARRIRELEATVLHYVHCRHACIDCFCTKEAKAALYPVPDTRDEHGK